MQDEARVVARRGLAVRLGPRARHASNNRLIAVPTTIDRLDDTRTMSDLSGRARDELDRFFLSATFFASKNAQIPGWKEADEVRQYVQRCQRQH